MSLSLSAALLAFTAGAFAYSDTCNTNVVAYWGQDSYAAGTGATTNLQQRLSYYCKDNSVDVFPIAFMDVFSGTGGVPEINLGNTCNSTTNSYFAGTALLDCSFLAADIQTCQAAGKKVTLSLGGAGGGGAMSAGLADQVWNLFLGGSSSTRPFGAAVLDGIDMDIEGGSGGQVDFANQLKSHYNGASKKYYLTAAPQCPYPDNNLGTTLNTVGFDAVYVQFYNNPYCAVQSFGTTGWNFGTWDYWAHRISANKNIKVYIGVPAGPTAAGAGAYVPASGLVPIIQSTRANFPSFAGVMFWDESQAYVNNRFDTAVKNALTNGGSCSGFVAPACNAAAWSASGNYPQGSTVTYDGYEWTARWYGSGAPTPSDTGSWLPIAACTGSGTTPPTTTTAAPPPGTTSTKPASSPTTSAPASGGSCSGVPTWNSQTAYTGGQEVVYQNSLYKANWWSEGDAPNGTAGDWTLVGSC